MWVHSTPSRGSTFTFVIPTKPAERAAPLAVATPPSALVPLRPLAILLVEDNAVNQLLALRLLERRGHTVTTAGDGREGLDALARSSFDVVLMDVQMPRVDGFEATAAIRAAERGTNRHQIIIAMTAHALKGDRERCRSAGMDGYLAKPISAERLDGALAELTGALPTVA